MADRADRRPDVVLVLADDMGFSDIGCYGGEIETPALDRLGRAGARLTQFYNTARCSPSRASLLTGLHPHQVGVGILNFDDQPDGYPGNLSDQSATIAETLKAAGYSTYMSGKWHVASDVETPNASWPTRRGFDEFYGTLEGAGSYYQPRTLVRGEANVEDEGLKPDFYYTDAISDHAVDCVRRHARDRPDQPFFSYVAYTAPHWPLHARAEDIAKYDGRFDAGWDRLRRERLERLLDEGILDRRWPLADRDPQVPPWESVPDQEWQASRMQAYAAQVEAMDRGVGRLVAALRELGRLDNTLFVFLSDNGGCAEEMPPESARDFVTSFVPIKERTRDGDEVVPGNVPGLAPGPESTYQSYGRSWAHLSNAPFREYKHWVHEGGIATPLIVHWPAGLAARGDVCHTPFQLVDVAPTLVEAAGAAPLTSRAGQPVPSGEGRSMLPALRGVPGGDADLFFEHEGNSAIRRGRWKLVRKHGQPWELYDMIADRTELIDVAAANPELVAELSASYQSWAQRCGVLPRERVLELYRARNLTSARAG